MLTLQNMELHTYVQFQYLKVDKDWCISRSDCLTTPATAAVTFGFCVVTCQVF